MEATPPRRQKQEEPLSPRTEGPFCEAYQEADVTEECGNFAHVSVFLRPGVRLGSYCFDCAARLVPRFVGRPVIKPIGGFPPQK